MDHSTHTKHAKKLTNQPTGPVECVNPLPHDDCLREWRVHAVNWILFKFVPKDWNRDFFVGQESFLVSRDLVEGFDGYWQN